MTKKMTYVLSGVSNEFFTKKPEQYFIIDVRTPEEYVGEYIPQEFSGEHIRLSLNIPLSADETGKVVDLEGRLLHVPSDTTAIFHCRSGRRTKNNEEMLIQWARDNGFAHVRFMSGGIQEWKNWGRATVIPQNPSVAQSSKPRFLKVVTQKESVLPEESALQVSMK